MKRKSSVLAVVFVAFMLLLAGCSQQVSSISASSVGGSGEPDPGAKLAMLAPVEEQDTPLVQGVWAAVLSFAGENALSKGFYKIQSGEAESTLELATKSGAEVVVLVGEGMSEILQKTQLSYPSVQFVLFSNEDVQLFSNSVRVSFLPEQAGWLAGYAAAFEAQGTVAYFESEDRQARLHALGFALGADAALQELGLPRGAVTLRPVFEVLGDIRETQVRMKEAMAESQWVFSNLYAMQSAVLSEADRLQLSSFAVGYDLVPENSSVVSVAQCSPHSILSQLLGEWMQGDYTGGVVVQGDIGNGGASLMMEGSRFEKFTQSDYDKAISFFSENNVQETLAGLITPEWVTSPLDLKLSTVTMHTAEQSA